VPPQRFLPPSHTHVPDLQVDPDGHTAPHLPQLFECVRRSTHEPWHSVLPDGQPVAKVVTVVVNVAVPAKVVVVVTIEAGSGLHVCNIVVGTATVVAMVVVVVTVTFKGSGVVPSGALARR